MLVLNIIQVIVSIILIIAILMQERSSGVAGLFGGGDSGGFYQTRRGLEKIIFITTIVLIAVFAGLSILHLII